MVVYISRGFGRILDTFSPRRALKPCPMRNLATLIACVFTFTLSAQNYCGFDALHALSHSHPGQQQAESEFNAQLTQRVLNMDLRDGDVLTIPVVVHIIHNNGEEDIPDSQVHDAIAHLNDAFANMGFYENGSGVTTDIEFCLASRDPEDNFTTGINRVVSTLTDVLVPSQEEEMKALSAWDSELYLNIWVVQEITREPSNSGVIGFATFPDSHGSATDGITIEAATFGSSEVGSGVHVHECGHYLGLYHTFQDGCPNDDCFNSGDRVCDTPPDSDVYAVFCNDGTNSCETDDDDLSDNNPFRPVVDGGLGDQLDMQTNFMDYSNLVCFERFTNGQSDRMRAALIDYRSSLLDGDQCAPPCENPIDPLVTTTDLEIEVGDNVFFTNLSDNFSFAEWAVNDVEAGEEQIFEFIPGTQGSYIIQLTLMNEDPGCTQVLTWEVIVSCTAQASFTYEGTSVPEGGTLELTNTSTGATNYTWYVDGIPVSADPNFSWEFDEPGGYAVYLEASNPTCTDQSLVLFISVGSCSSGNEANLWHHFNPSGSNYGFDFNQTPVGFIPDNNIPPIAGHCKSTLCDANGNLMALSLGVQVLNRDYEVMPNGADLLGNASSHYGTLFVQKPGSESEYYVFTTASTEDFDNGLRYHLVDFDLEDGLGDVTEKNVFIASVQQEAITAVRHCNLVDFWLLTYNQEISAYQAWLVTNEGVADTPVTTDIATDALFSLPLVPSARGNRIAHGSRVLDFNAATGELTDELGIVPPPNVVGWELSASGQYLYLNAGDFTTTIYQVDLDDFDPANPLEDAYTFPVSGNPVYFYPQRGPDGNIYMEDVFTNDLARIVNPNLPGELTTFESEFDNAGSLINSFGNYYHAYLSGKTIFIDGPANVCQGQTVEYSIYGHECITDLIDWAADGDVSLEETDNGVLLVTFHTQGSVAVMAGLETVCGEVSDALAVTVGPPSGLDLGSDFGQCTGGNAPELDAGDGFDSYDWSTGESTQVIVPDGSGVFSVTVTNMYCTDTDEVTVTEEFDPSIDLGPDTDICDGVVLVLDAGTGFNDYVWQDGTTGPTFTVFEGGTYTVTATVPCFGFDEIVIDDCGQVIDNVGEVDGFISSIYPNPNTGTFSIETGTGSIERIQVFAADGKLVLDETAAGSNRVEVLLDCAPGVYTVAVTNAGITQRAQIIVQ